MARAVDGSLDRATSAHRTADLLEPDIVTVVDGADGLRGAVIASRGPSPEPATTCSLATQTPRWPWSGTWAREAGTCDGAGLATCGSSDVTAPIGTPTSADGEPDLATRSGEGVARVALARGYGVVLGTVNRYYRDPVNDYGQYFHGNLVVQAPACRYHCAMTSTASSYPTA
ncbi:MAG TPA: hypothetical protein VK908_02410 [Jiangellales bacterium]|nr:hypothetical protein [Jiangellales bacterium]